MPGARAVRGWPVIAAQLLEGTFGLSLSKASAHQHNHDVDQLLESLALLSLSKGRRAVLRSAAYPRLTSFCIDRSSLPGIIIANSASDTSATYMSPRESTAIPWGA